MGTAVSITSIVGLGVWLDWLVAAANGVGVAGVLVWQAVRVKTAQLTMTKTKILLSWSVKNLFILQKCSHVSV